MNRTIYRNQAARECEEALRSDTAGILHRATCGNSKLVAASLGVSQSRVNKLIAGGVANPLELLARWIDRLEREGVPAESIDAIVRFLAARRRLVLVRESDAASPAGELSAIADDLAKGAELAEKAAKAAVDGIDAAEAELLMPLAEKHAESAAAFRRRLEEKRGKKAAPASPGGVH